MKEEETLIQSPTIKRSERRIRSTMSPSVTTSPIAQRKEKQEELSSLSDGEPPSSDFESDLSNDIEQAGADEEGTTSSLSSSDDSTSALYQKPPEVVALEIKGTFTIPRQVDFIDREVEDVTYFMMSVRPDASFDFAERSSVLTSIEWLSHHVPICVLNQLGHEARLEKSDVLKRAESAESYSMGRRRSLRSPVQRDLHGSFADLSDRASESDSMDPFNHPQQLADSQATNPTATNLGSTRRITPERDLQVGRPIRRLMRRSSVGRSPALRSALQVVSTHEKNDMEAQNAMDLFEVDEKRPASRNVVERRPVAASASINRIDQNYEPDPPTREVGQSGSKLDDETKHRSHATPLSTKNSSSGEEFVGVGPQQSETVFNRHTNTIGDMDSKHLLNKKDGNSPFNVEDEKAMEYTSRRLTLTKIASQRSLRLQKGKRAYAVPDSYHLPRAERHSSALLFVDIAGFTKLSTTLDPESFSKAINSYFQRIVDEATSFGGDILKFAGDAVFVEWKAAPPKQCSTQELVWSPQMKLADCVLIAASCAASIVAKCSDFPIFAHGGHGFVGPRGQVGQGGQVATLNVHCGLGCGELVGVHCGDYHSRREFIVIGDPIDQVAVAVDAAAMGEVAVSRAALASLKKTCNLDVDHEDRKRPLVIARRTVTSFKPKTNRRRLEPGDGLTLSKKIEKWNVDSLRHYQKLISLYAHPVVVNNDASAGKKASIITAQERHREEAELRDVYVMFIAPLVSTRVTGSDEIDGQLFILLNSIINLTTRELNKSMGHLRQFIVDDKGLVLIATFGLRGSTFPNMVSERALPCTISIHNALLTELGIENQIGATSGKAYCGVVGGLKRHEYAVLGPSVNLAARLMSSPTNPGILVDDAVRHMADRSYAFNALPPVRAKGYTEPVPIFEPLSPLERRWGRVQPNFVGRKTEIMKLMKTAREMALSASSRPKVVFVSGDIGIGKSSMVVHAIEHIRKLMGASGRKLIVAKHVSKESHKLVPFGIFQSILVDVIGHFRSSSTDDKSVDTFLSGGLQSIGWESLDGASFAPSQTSGLTRSADRLNSLCRELNAPPAFQELVGRHLLGMEGTGKIRETKNNRRNSNNMKPLVSFMARAFLRCTQESSLVILALDDVHHMDEMSWKVIQQLFKTGTGILCICASRPLATNKLAIPKLFWEELNNPKRKDERFISIELQRLDESEVKDMIAKTLGLQATDVNATMVKDVFMQSGGLPSFANEILESMKRIRSKEGNISHRAEYNEEASFASVAELLLHRIDTVEASVRDALNIGAVLGNSFDLKEIGAVMKEEVGPKEHLENLLEKTRKALDKAVSEGILYVTHSEESGDANEEMPFHESTGNFSDVLSVGTDAWQHGKNAVSYSFCHDVWRSIILNLMLDSRKRDMHRTIAVTLQKHQRSDADDYVSRMKLFSHWKASGDTSEAANLALSIGKSFEQLGLQDQSIKLYEDALEMWRTTNREVTPPRIGLTEEDYAAMQVNDVANTVKIYIALGKCLSNIHKAAEGVQAYQQALNVLRHADSAGDLEDRSIVFPIFSGLFVAVKFGQIEQDEDCTYEQALVSRFVLEAKLHGDPVHYTRALAMQGEMYGRLGMYDKAFEAHNLLTEIYDPEIHSASICEHFGSDRSAQSFAVSALWYKAMGQEEKAVEQCWYVINELLPKMDPRNVHNSTIMLYPLLWILKDQGAALEAREIFIQHVVERFDEFYGDGRSTFCLPLYEPIMILLDLAGHPDVITDEFDEYVDWALDEENLRFGTVINSCMANFGTAADSVTAEICLSLARHMNECEEKKELVRTGLHLATEMVSFTGASRMIQAKKQIEAIYTELLEMASQLSMTMSSLRS